MAWERHMGMSDASADILGMLRRAGRVFGGKYVECIPRGIQLLRKARDKRLVRNFKGAFRPIIPYEG